MGNEGERKNSKKLSDEELRYKAKAWFSKATKEQVIDRLVEHKKLYNVLEKLDSGLNVDSNGYGEYIKFLRVFLLGEESELLKIEEIVEHKNVEIGKLSKKIKVLEEIIKSESLKVQDLKKDIELKESMLVDKDNEIYKLQLNGKAIENKIKILRKSCSKLKLENAEYKKKEERMNKGKKHIRGTEEFYRDILISCSLITTKEIKGGKVVNDYREALKYARCCDTIQNYCNANKVKLNRDNLKNWWSIAEALEKGADPHVEVGKYNQSKGYHK